MCCANTSFTLTFALPAHTPQEDPPRVWVQVQVFARYGWGGGISLWLPTVSLAWASCPLGQGRVLGTCCMCLSWQALTCEVVGSGQAGRAGKIIRTERFTEISSLKWRGVGHEWEVCLGRHLVVGTRLFQGSPIGERTGRLLSEHQCRPSLCDAEAVLFLLFHIKRMNTVLEGVESSLRQEELSDK